MGVFTGGADRTGIFSNGVQVNGVFVGGANRLAAAVANADGIATWVLTTTGNDQAGSDMFGNYGAYGPYSPLSVTLVDTTIETVQRNQTRTRSVQRIIGGTVRVDTYTATITTQRTGTGTNPTVLAGTQGQGNVTIGGTESRTVLVSGGSATAVTPTVANGGIENNPNNPVTIPNTTYEEPVDDVGPTALITGATSAVRPATVQLTDASTAGTNPITSAVWSSSIETMISVNQSGLVTPFGALTTTITLVVSDGTLSDSDTHSVAFSNPTAPTIFVSPKTRSIAGGGGTGTAFTVSTTGTGVSVSVTGENAGVIPSWLSISNDGTWSASENTGTARSTVVRFTVTDALSQTTFNEVTVSQAQAVATATCFTYTFTHGVSGTGPPPNIGSYVLCDGTVQANTSLEDGFSACIQEGTALSAGTGSWSQGTGC